MQTIDRSLVQYNRTEEELDRWVGIYDCTLRDGEQAAGVVFNRQDKLQLARLLDAVGVDRIEVGMPVISAEDQAAARDIVEAGLQAELWGFCRCLKGDIDACIDVGLQHVILEAPTSHHKLRAYSLTQEKVLARALSMIEYARNHGLYVAFFAVDATRTDEGFLTQVFQAAVEAGAQEAVLPDTLSVATPDTIAHLTAQVREWTDVPVMVHCHNDFGLATACSLAGVQAGASYVHVTVNGLGEKAGNADIAEVAFALSVLMGYRHNLNMEMLPELARLGERLSNVPLAPQKPVVGEKAFTRESGVVVSQLNTYPPAVEAYDPNLVGRQTEVVLGKKSGKSSVKYMLEKLGLPSLTDEQVKDMVVSIKELSLQKKSSLQEDEFIDLLMQFREEPV